ncbi:MAG: hypothetical protein Q9162_004923 [Coniocarpon cinnabarinum]
MYARGILFGKMKYELGDHSYVKCPETGLEADIEFTNKGYFSGKDNAVKGVIKNRAGKILFEVSGEWNGKMFVKDSASGKQDLVFDATSARETYPNARPVEEQEECESQRLWLKTTQALKRRDHEAATEEKSRIEDRQREEAARRGAEDKWEPKLFRQVQNGAGSPDEGEENLDWVINAKIDGKTAQEQTAQILSIAPVLPQSEIEHIRHGQQLSAMGDGATSTTSIQPTNPQATQNDSIGSARVHRLDSLAGDTDEFVDANSTFQA